VQRDGLLNYANEVVKRVVSDAARYAPEERLSALAARLSDELSLCDALTRELVVNRVARYIQLHPEQLRRFVESSTSNARTSTATLVAATEIASQAENVQWIPLLGVDGYIGRELVTLLSAEPKTGKTTLLLHAVRDWVSCGQRVVWFSEESRSAWKQRVERHADLRSDCFLLAFENSATARGVPFATALREARPDIAILDTVRAFCDIPDENDAATVSRGLQPFITVARDVRCALILVHHARRTDGLYAGSHAFAGAADVLISLKRVDNNPRQRELSAVSRFDDTPPSVLLELDADVYRVLGSTAAYVTVNLAEQVAELLSSTPRTTREIWTLLGETKPHYETVRRALTMLEEQRIARRIAGRGRTPDRWIAASADGDDAEDDPFADMWDGLCVRCGRDAVDGSEYCLNCLRGVNKA
jgi:predicted ATP-dependent serine protease